MLLTVSRIAKAFGPSEILHNINFVINPGEHVGLVGANGSGKSTLLRIVSGEIDADAGLVAFAPGTAAGYLAQEVSAPSGATIDDLLLEAVGELRRIEQRLRELEFVMADPACTGEALEATLQEYGVCQERFERRGGYDIDYRIDSVFAGLRIGHIARDRLFGTLSGGEQARVQLAGLLLQSPDILLLDEPTNHLDFASIAWLEGYLAGFRGGMLAVSHDRHFLNRTVTRILEIDEHTHGMAEYVGNYDDYLSERQSQRATWLEAYAAQQDEVAELKRAIRVSARQVGHNRAPRDGAKTQYDFKGGRVQIAVSRNVRNAEERLRRIEADPVPKPPEMLRIAPEFENEPLRSESVIALSRVSVTYDGRAILRDVSCSVGPDERIVLLGPNGAGKTTLLNVIAGLVQPERGNVRLAPDARLGYLAQDAGADDPTITLLNAYRDGLIGYEDEFVRDLFRYGLFTLDDLEKPVGALSAGQRRKLQIARLIATGANVLLLDEPTNHLSFDILEEFERAVLEFQGPVIAVSHDRWFIERFGGLVWELRDGRLIQHAAYGPAITSDMLAVSN